MLYRYFGLGGLSDIYLIKVWFVIKSFFCVVWGWMKIFCYNDVFVIFFEKGNSVVICIVMIKDV